MWFIKLYSLKLIGSKVFYFCQADALEVIINDCQAEALEAQYKLFFNKLFPLFRTWQKTLIGS